MRVVVGLAFAVALLFAPSAALRARADDGGASPSPRAPTTVLRHVDTATARVTAIPPQKQLVIIVGGYQSCVCDGSFKPLEDRLVGAGFDVREFGEDRDFPYDTYGAIDVSARSLRDEVRHLAPQYAGVHLVTHSMGGVVADRAFAQGLSADDGVLTYISLSAPHSGSAAAGVASSLSLISGGDGGPIRQGLLLASMEDDSPAVRDLASTRPIAPPRGIVRLDLREGTDMLVTADDARDPGVASRVFLTAAPDGHGEILKDTRALDMTVATIITRRVPPDTRSWRLLASAESSALNTLAVTLLCGIAVVGCIGALLLRGPIRPIRELADRLLPRASRRTCP